MTRLIVRGGCDSRDHFPDIVTLLKIGENEVARYVCPKCHRVTKYAKRSGMIKNDTANLPRSSVYDPSDVPSL